MCLNQMIQTQEQQHYLAKLLGFQYTIVYKLGRENRVADALSRQPDEKRLQFLALSQVRFQLLNQLRHENASFEFFQSLYRAIREKPSKYVDYEVRDGLLLLSEKLLLDPSSSIVQQVLNEAHTTLLGGHGGIQKSIARVRVAFTWLGMRKVIKEYVQQCVGCQQKKISIQSPRGLL